MDFWNEATFSHIREQYAQDSMHHALLIIAPEGAGREGLSKSVADWMLCTESTDSACGMCKSCSLQNANSHPDYYELAVEEGKTQIAVDQVRSLINDLHESAHQGGWKVANITNVHALNASSFNALLKTLEEPAAKTLIVLQATHLQRVPATIRSRSQLVNLARPTESELHNWLTEQSNSAEANLQDMQLAVRLFADAPYQALEFIEQQKAQQCHKFIDGLAELFERRCSPIEFSTAWQTELESSVTWFQMILRDSLLLSDNLLNKNPEQAVDNLIFRTAEQTITRIAMQLTSQANILLQEKINELQRLIKQKASVNLVASWQSTCIYCQQLVQKYQAVRN